jgi:hypothetical protein
MRKYFSSIRDSIKSRKVMLRKGRRENFDEKYLTCSSLINHREVCSGRMVNLIKIFNLFEIDKLPKACFRRMVNSKKIFSSFEIDNPPKVCFKGRMTNSMTNTRSTRVLKTVQFNLFKIDKSPKICFLKNGKFNENVQFIRDY